MTEKNYKENIIPPEIKKSEKLSFPPNLIERTKQVLDNAFSGVKKVGREAMATAGISLKKAGDFINKNRQNIAVGLASVGFMANMNMHQVQASDIASYEVASAPKVEQLKNAPALQALQTLNSSQTNINKVALERAELNAVGMGNNVNPAKGEYGNVTDIRTQEVLKGQQDAKIAKEAQRIENDIKDIQSKNPSFTPKQAILQQALNDAVNGGYNSAEKEIQAMLQRASANIPATPKISPTPSIAPTPTVEPTPWDILLGVGGLASLYIYLNRYQIFEFLKRKKAESARRRPEDPTTINAKPDQRAQPNSVVTPPDPNFKPSAIKVQELPIPPIIKYTPYEVNGETAQFLKKFINHIKNNNRYNELTNKYTKGNDDDMGRKMAITYIAFNVLKNHNSNSHSNDKHLNHLKDKLNLDLKCSNLNTFDFDNKPDELKKCTDSFVKIVEELLAEGGKKEKASTLPAVELNETTNSDTEHKSDEQTPTVELTTTTPQVPLTKAQERFEMENEREELIKEIKTTLRQAQERFEMENEREELIKEIKTLRQRPIITEGTFLFGLKIDETITYSQFISEVLHYKSNNSILNEDQIKKLGEKKFRNISAIKLSKNIPENVFNSLETQLKEQTGYNIDDLYELSGSDIYSATEISGSQKRTVEKLKADIEATKKAIEVINQILFEN